MSADKLAYLERELDRLVENYTDLLMQGLDVNNPAVTRTAIGVENMKAKVDAARAELEGITR